MPRPALTTKMLKTVAKQATAIYEGPRRTILVWCPFQNERMRIMRVFIDMLELDVSEIHCASDSVTTRQGHLVMFLVPEQDSHKFFMGLSRDSLSYVDHSVKYHKMREPWYTEWKYWESERFKHE
jgi:hypothetical protein